MDAAQIVHAIDTGLIVDLKFCNFWFENSHQGKSNLGHEFVQTKQFSDKLGYDIKRGLEEKAHMGYFPGVAPRGYLNDRLRKIIVVDPVLGPIIRKGFVLYAEGRTSLEQLSAFFFAEGMVSKRIRHKNCPGGNPLHRDVVRKILSDPFYYGEFLYAGEILEGKHQPLISKQLFERAQRVLEDRSHHAPEQSVPKAFTKLLRCGECRMMITAEKQKGHIYYRCTRKSGALKCSQPFIREEDLDCELIQLLQPFSISKTISDDLLRRLEADEVTMEQQSNALLEQKRMELDHLTAKLQKLLDTYLEEVIDRETFIERKNGLLAERKRVRRQIAICEDSSNAWLEPFKKWVSTATNMAEITKTGTLEQRKTLAKEVFGSNLMLLGKKARGSAIKPWSFLSEKPDCHVLVCLYDMARTFFIENDPLEK